MKELIAAGGSAFLVPAVLFGLVLYAIRGLFGLHGRRSQHRKEFLELWESSRSQDDLWLEVAIRHLFGTYRLALPACINNIIQGRSFEQFERMDLDTYITTNKAGRARCLDSNPAFFPLYSELDSTLRNGSHHRGLRLKPGRNHIVQYRTGDHQEWKEIRYTEYLWRCNRILMCALHLLGLQIYALGLDTRDAH